MPRARVEVLGDPAVWSRHPHAPPPGTELGALDAIADGEGREHTVGPEPEPFSMIIVRRGATAFGYVNFCPHFGIPLNARRDRFTADGEIMCSMHFALFRFDDGMCTDGACEGQGLDPVPIEVTSDGVIRIRAG